MPVWCRRADAGRTGNLREAEAGRPSFGDQRARRPHQRLTEIAVMIRLALATVVVSEAHALMLTSCRPLANADKPVAFRIHPPPRRRSPFLRSRNSRPSLTSGTPSYSTTSAVA